MNQSVNQYDSYCNVARNENNLKTAKVTFYLSETLKLLLQFVKNLISFSATAFMLTSFFVKTVEFLVLNCYLYVTIQLSDLCFVQAFTTVIVTIQDMYGNHLALPSKVSSYVTTSTLAYKFITKPVTSSLRKNTV